MNDGDGSGVSRDDVFRAFRGLRGRMVGLLGRDGVSYVAMFALAASLHPDEPGAVDMTAVDRDLDKLVAAYVSARFGGGDVAVMSACQAMGRVLDVFEDMRG